MRELGAVGDVCFRFFDADGVRSVEIDQRLIGIGSDDLVKIPRRIGVAGGERKFTAIRAALRGRWINVLITDCHGGTARSEIPTAQRRTTRRRLSRR